MRTLLLSSFFPPDAQGGAEISAWNLARWLRDHGHTVGVLTTARRPQDVAAGIVEDGLTIWRVHMPRPYPVHDYGTRGASARALWHLQDHLDPRNRTILQEVLDDFAPDFITIHLLTGLGWNMLGEVARRDLPVLFVLPDLALACLRSGMFRRGHDCIAQCRECRLSSWWKMRGIAQIDRIGFQSPSLANLTRLERFVALADKPRRVLMNANRYPPAQTAHVASEHVRFLYAGRLHPTKGVDILLAAARRVAQTRRFTLELAGDGPDAAALRARYDGASWVRFLGRLTQTALAERMVASDVLCVPSIWSENAPGVVVQAVALGLPVIASAIGGLPELVEPGRTGKLVTAGDVDAWTDALADVIDRPDQLAELRAHTLAQADAFDPELLGAQIYRFMEAIQARGRSASTNDRA